MTRLLSTILLFIFITTTTINPQILLVYANGSSLFGFISDHKVVLSSSGVLHVNNVALRLDFDWIRQYGDVCVGLQGEVSDCEYVFSLLDGYNRLHHLNYEDRGLSVTAISNLCRNVIAKQLRQSNQQLNVNGFIAGWDRSINKPVLYWFDSLGAMQKVFRGAHGSEFMLLLSQLDYQLSISFSKLENSIQENKANEVNEESKENKVQRIVKFCWNSIEKRGIGKIGNIQTKIISSSGVHSIP